MKRIVLIRSNPIKPDPPVEKMANALIGMGYKVTILAWDRSQNYASSHEVIRFSNGECDIVRFGIMASYGGGVKKNIKPLVIFQIRLFHWLRRNKNNFDIIHAFDFDTGLIASKISKVYHKQMVYHILDYYIDSHNINSKLLRNIVRESENKVIASAEATVLCTEKRKQQIAGSKPRKIVVIHNTPDSSVKAYNNPLINNNNKSAIRIAYVGILANSRMLMELCDIVSKSPQFELHIGGFGPLQDRIKDYSNSVDNIYYYGRLSYDKTLELENECDIMVAIYDPSIRNNQFSAPNKFYEALMLGKPIVMAKGTGFDDIIKEHNIGELVSFDYDGVRKGLKRMGERRNEWSIIKTCENTLYKKSYSWDIMTTRIKKLYLSLEKQGEAF